MAVAFVESNGYGDATTAATLTFTGFASTINIGDLLAIGWGVFGGTRTVSSVNDNSSQTGVANVYTARTPLSTGSSQIGTIYLLVTRSILTTDTITITLSGTNLGRSGLLLRFTGCTGSFDTAGYKNVTGNTIAIGPTQPLAYNGELAVGFATYKGTSATPGYSDSTTGYTAVNGVSSGASANFIQVDAGYRLDAGFLAETDTHTYTTGGANLIGEILTFVGKTSSSSPAGSQFPRHIGPNAIGLGK